MIGLVGASGTGKSTLINLIMRLYDVDQGKITIDGVDIKNIKTESLHSQIGVVLPGNFSIFRQHPCQYSVCKARTLRLLR